jgi:hypothetical protein
MNISSMIMYTTFIIDIYEEKGKGHPLETLKGFFLFSF